MRPFNQKIIKKSYIISLLKKKSDTHDTRNSGTIFEEGASGHRQASKYGISLQYCNKME